MGHGRRHPRLTRLLRNTAATVVLASAFANAAHADVGLSSAQEGPLAPLATTTSGLSSTLGDSVTATTSAAGGAVGATQATGEQVHGALEQTANDTLSSAGEALDQTTESTTSTLEQTANDTLSSAGETLDRSTESTTSTLEQTVDQGLGGPYFQLAPIAPAGQVSPSATAQVTESVVPPASASEPPAATSILGWQGPAAAPRVAKAASRPAGLEEAGRPSTAPESSRPGDSARSEHGTRVPGLTAPHDPEDGAKASPPPWVPGLPGDSSTPLQALVQALAGSGVLMTAVLVGLLGLSRQLGVSRRLRATVDLLRPSDVLFRLERPG